MTTVETVYAIHIVDKDGKRVFTSDALLAEDVRTVLKSIKVARNLKKRVYDICYTRYISSLSEVKSKSTIYGKKRSRNRR